MMERLLGGHVSQEGIDAPIGIVTQHKLKEAAKHAVSILLAEDNPVNQKLASILLTRAGYKVEVAVNGAEAVAKYRAQPDRYNLILMDIQMPVLDGLEATRAIRQWEFETAIGRPTAGRRIPVIAMTAEAMKGDREKCLAAGMDDYISKPIKREEVFGQIKRWVLPAME